MDGPFRVESAWPLLLLVAALLFVAWAGRRTLTNFARPQRLLQAGVRGLLIALVALAVARPVWNRERRQVSVVYLVDVSASVSPAAVAHAADWIAEAHRRRAPDHWRIVAFGGAAAPVPDLDALRALARGDKDASALDVSSTNLERALDEARASFAPRHLRRAVVFTDGRSTSGDLRLAIARLQQDDVRVHAVALAPRDVGDAWIDAVSGPDRVNARAAFPIDVMVFSQTPRSAVVEIRHRGRAVAARTVALPAGSTTVALDARLPEAGPAAIEAVLRVDGDPVAVNNTARLAVDVQPRPKILYAEGRPQSARYLRGALEAGGFDVAVASPSSVPNRAAALDAFDAVVLSDVEARELTVETMTALEQYVSLGGGGLVMAGGEAVYGERGYSDTPLERALPVTFDVKHSDEVAVVIVLDKSWSMAGTTIELAKEACKAAVDVLADHHLVGVVAFNHDFDWPVRLQRAENRAQIRARISGIEPGGHTVIYPALEDAYHALRDVAAPTRHVILLSDGQTYDDPYQALVTRMAGARITVSTVAVGPDADRALLANIARWGQGRAYAFADAREVPQIFIKETERIARRSLDEETARAIVRQPSSLFRGLSIASAPALLGYTRTRARDAAEVLLAAPSDDPLLARWQFGLGRTVMFTSDVKDRWAAGWLRWPGYAAFWTRVVRDVMRRPDTTGGLRLERIERPDGRVEARIAFDAIDRAGRFANLIEPRVEIAGGERVQTVALAQTAPGHYEGTSPIDESRDYLVRTRFDRPPALAPGLPLAGFLVAARADEYRFRPPDVELLEALSRDTGGTFDPDPAQVTAPGAETTRAPVVLWPWLVACALVVYLVDLLLRRVRLFEGSASATGAPGMLGSTSQSA